MPDISMCQDKACPSRKSCYRFMAKPDPIAQSYAAFDRGDHDKCEEYWGVSHIWEVTRWQTTKVEAPTMLDAEQMAEKLDDYEWATFGIMEVKQVE